VEALVNIWLRLRHAEFIRPYKYRAPALLQKRGEHYPGLPPRLRRVHASHAGCDARLESQERRVAPRVVVLLQV
jgi:hypothetical protein